MSYSLDIEGTDPGGKRMTAKLDISVKDVKIAPPEQPADLPFMHGLNKNTTPLSDVTTNGKLVNFLADNGFSLLRYRIYWENFLEAPMKTLAAIEDMANAADMRGIKVIYTNMQVGMSSYFPKEQGKAQPAGFPPDMVASAIGPLTNYPDLVTARKAFMRKYWDNTIQWNGQSVWEAQADFMLQVFAANRDRPSTLGYEIFNEPRTLEPGDNLKLKAMQEYIGNALIDADPDAWILAAQRHAWYATSHWSIADAVASFPAISNGKVAYTGHTYFGAGAPQLDFYTKQIEGIQLATGAPIIIGEWDVEVTPADTVAMKKVIDRFQAKGWSLCLWAFDTRDQSHSCFTQDYEPSTRGVWAALLNAMGQTQVGAPK